jgi:hypothetical protein
MSRRDHVLVDDDHSWRSTDDRSLKPTHVQIASNQGHMLALLQDLYEATADQLGTAAQSDRDTLRALARRTLPAHYSLQPGIAAQRNRAHGSDLILTGVVDVADMVKGHWYRTRFCRPIAGTRGHSR